jgi:hypothetical protein
MYKALIYCVILFAFINFKGYSVEISYTLLDGTKGTINVPDDIVEISAFKGNMNFIRSNGDRINLRTVSPMTEIIGIENLPVLKRMELALQLHCDNLLFLRNSSLEYLLINWLTELNDLDFLINLPNLKYLGLQAMNYNNNVMDLRNTQIKYLIVSYIWTNETIEIIRNNYLEEFIYFYSNIVLNDNQNIKIIDNYNDFRFEQKHFSLFDW